MTQPREGIFAHWPNRITMLRFGGSFVLFVVLSVWGMGMEMPRAAIQTTFWLFLVVAFSDALDGYLARRDNVITAFGRIADPFVDKVLVMGTMIYLAVMPWSQDWFPAWIVVVVLAREFLVTAIRGYVESLGLEFPADWFGKIKMILQCIAIGVILGLFAFDWPGVLARFLSGACHVFVWGMLLCSIGSGVSYVLKTRRMLDEVNA